MRYIILIVLNAPIIAIALLNIITRFKLKKIDKRRFRRSLVLWLIIILVLIGSFPLYNLWLGRPLLESELLSWFDIIQTTAIVYLLYFVSRQSQRSEETEKRLRELHQELSIRLSDK